MMPSYVLPSLLFSPQTPHASATAWSGSATRARIVDGWCRRTSQRQRITAISLYGLLDERSDASVHRSLSELTPLLADGRYNELLLLGGDLNPLWSVGRTTRTFERIQRVVDRVTPGFGLEDLLLKTLT